jgi:hypothetical protein
MYERSAWPSSRRDGVPTAMNTASAEPTASLKSIEKDRRESLTLLRTSSSKPGSKKGISQRCSARILVVSLSIANYMMAKVSQAGADTNPTYPVPIIAMRIVPPLARSIRSAT